MSTDCREPRRPDAIEALLTGALLSIVHSWSLNQVVKIKSIQSIMLGPDYSNTIEIVLESGRKVHLIVEGEPVDGGV